MPGGLHAFEILCADLNAQVDDALVRISAMSTMELSEVVERMRVPVLLTYESECVAAHDQCHDEYCAALAAEVAGIQRRFADRNLPSDVLIELLLVPMDKKADLVRELETRLKAWRLLA